MLRLTEKAIEAVRELASAGRWDTGMSGVRISSEEAFGVAEFHAGIVGLPAEDDEVIEQDDARVFLDGVASSLLDGKVLDATVRQGRIEFTVSDRL